MAIKSADNMRPIKIKTNRTESSIKNIDDLRRHALITLDRLQAYEVSIEEAGVVGKLCESVMSTVKSEMEYAKMLGIKPDIGFVRTDDAIPLQKIEEKKISRDAS